MPEAEQSSRFYSFPPASTRLGADPPSIPAVTKPDKRKQLRFLQLPHSPLLLRYQQSIALPPLCPHAVFLLCNLLTCLWLIVLQTALFRGDFHSKQSVFPKLHFFPSKPLMSGKITGNLNTRQSIRRGLGSTKRKCI